MGFGRNDPCPCGSGRKYKKCCYGKSFAEQSNALPRGKFSYVSGSYGGPGRGFLPSLICKKLVSDDQWEDYYCLVKAHEVLDQEDLATAVAKSDLERAKSSAGSPVEFAKMLHDSGYKKLDEFRLAED